MKKIMALLLVLISITWSSSIAQHTDNFNYKQSVIRINLLGIPAFGFEQGLGNGFTFRPEAGLGWPVITSETNTAGTEVISLESAVNPYVEIEGRYYYNLQRRAAAQRNTKHFAANYIACLYRYNAYEYQAGLSDGNRDDKGSLKRDVQYIAAGWGIQRNLGRKDQLYINWGIGPDLRINGTQSADFTLQAQFGFGFQW